MGVDYYYVNRIKSQFYSCGLFGRSSRFNAIGQGPGARALAILLSDRGTWKNDRISVVADSVPEFEDIFSTFDNIDASVALMLIDIDGLEWIERSLSESTLVFGLVCAIGILTRRQDVVKLLDTKYGIGKWHKEYERYLHGNTDLWSQKVIDALNRDLKILA